MKIQSKIDKMNSKFEVWTHSKIKKGYGSKEKKKAVNPDTRAAIFVGQFSAKCSPDWIKKAGE